MPHFLEREAVSPPPHNVAVYKGIFWVCLELTLDSKYLTYLSVTWKKAEYC